MQQQQRIDIANNIVTPAATERSNNVIATRAGCNQCNHASANNGLEHDICDPASMHFNILLLSASSRFNIGTNFLNWESRAGKDSGSGIPWTAFLFCSSTGLLRYPIKMESLREHTLKQEMKLNTLVGSNNFPINAARSRVDGAHLHALSVRRAAFDGRHVRRSALGAQRTLDAGCAALGARHSALSRVRCSRASVARQTALNH